MLMRIAAFGFRSMPSRPGCAGADKFAAELFPRLVQRGHTVVAYNRLYPGETALANDWRGVTLRNIGTLTRRKGFDTLLHGLRCTIDIIAHDTADVVHIQNGGNSPYALGNTFQWELKEMGYNEKFVEVATEAMIVYITRRNPADAS